MFCEGLVCFELCGGAAGTESLYSGRLECIDDTPRKRVFGADYSKPYALLFGKVDEPVCVIDADIDIFAATGGAGIAGGGVERAQILRLGQFPGESVLASATAD